MNSSRERSGIFSRTEEAILSELRRSPHLPEHEGDVLQICGNIALLRKARGMTQARLACLSGVCPACLRDIEHGCSNMTIQNLLCVADAFGLSLTELNDCAMSEEELIGLVRKARRMAGLRG